MDRHKIKEQLMELFPSLNENKAEFLAKTGDEINVLITRVLDNNIEPQVYDIKELTRKPRSNYIQQTFYNYPEVFSPVSQVDMHIDIKGLRRKAHVLNEEASVLTKKAIGHPIKEARIYFSIEADNKREKAKELNKQAALVLMRKAVEGTGPIDFHGFTADEALKFMDDFYRFKPFKEIEVVTGQIYNSSVIRPALKEWFLNKNFICIDKGPSLVCIKKSIEYFEKKNYRFKK